jgi:hypothetical protein
MLAVLTHQSPTPTIEVYSHSAAFFAEEIHMAYHGNLQLYSYHTATQTIGHRDGFDT